MVLATLAFDGYRIFYVILIRVVIDGINSNLYAVNSAVPQIAVISPTLFLLFVIDLLCLTTNPIYSFADDRCLCHS